MGENSNIEWTDSTWPIVQGCDPVSQGCVGCYAVPLLWRMAHNPDPKISGPLQGLTEKHTNAAGETILRFTGKVALREDRLTWPLQWKKPRMIFVPSHGDIFHKGVPIEFLAKIFATMWRARQHTYQVLTKRAQRMCEVLDDGDFVLQVLAELSEQERGAGLPWPLPNVWFGVSAERQEEWDARKEHLRNTPAAVRFASFEPLLGRIIEPWLADYIQWGIVGGESGRLARPMHPDWAHSLRDQCRDAGVAFFFKQWGAWRHEPLVGKAHGCFVDDQFTYKIPWNPGGLNARCMARVGKRAAGRLLDGIEHNGFPAAHRSLASAA